MKLTEILVYMDEYIIFAKSAGTILTMKAIQNNIVKAKKCIFLGIPDMWAKERNIEISDLIKRLDIQTTFLQHTDDPLMSSYELKKLLYSHPNKSKFELIEKKFKFT